MGSDIYILKAGIEHELSAGATRHVRVAPWSLLTDGVFNSRPQEAASIVDRLTDKDGSRLLLAALDGKEISPLPESSHTTHAWKRLTTAIAVRPDDPENETRVRVIRELLGLKSEFASWWMERLSEATATSSEQSWLAIGASCEVAAGSNLPIPGVSADDGWSAQLILNAGLVPEEGSPLEAQLLRAVLDGQCTETTSVRSVPAQIAVALSPAAFYTFGPDATQPRSATASPDRRSQAIQHLRRSGSPYVQIAGLRRFRRGEKGSTFPWANTATALLQHTGRCWLVSEIAVVGAASTLGNGFTRALGTEALGSGSHPSTLIEQTRANRTNADWWRQRLVACQDDLAYAEWAIALWAIASGPVIDELFGELVSVIERVSPRYQRAFQVAAVRLAHAGFLARRTVTSHADTGVLSTVLAARNSELTHGPGSTAHRTQSTDDTKTRALAAVVRRAKWLQVDRVATYH